MCRRCPTMQKVFECRKGMCTKICEICRLLDGQRCVCDCAEGVQLCRECPTVQRVSNCAGEDDANTCNHGEEIIAVHER